MSTNEGNFNNKILTNNMDQMITYSNSRTDDEILPGTQVSDLAA